MAEEKANAEAAPPKSKKKLIIIIAAVALLGGGGGAAFFMMKPKGDHAKKEAAHEAPAEKATFMTLETFTVNLVPDAGEEYLQADISLQLKDAKEEAILKDNMPMVKSRILMILSSKKGSEIKTMEGKESLTKQIMTELNKPFVNGGKPQTISGVFFTNFIIQ